MGNKCCNVKIFKWFVTFDCVRDALLEPFAHQPHCVVGELFLGHRLKVDGLVEGLGLLHQSLVRGFPCGLGVAERLGHGHVELLDAADRGEYGEHIIAVVAEILISCHKRPLVIFRIKDVLAVELRVVGEMQQGEYGRHQVDLRAEFLHPLRTDEARGIYDRRDVVLVNRDAGLAGAGGAVVGHDDKHGVAEPRLARCLGEELADGEVGVLNCG